MSDVALTAETVTLSSVGDMAVGRGQFRLENRGAEVVQAAVVETAVRVGDRRREVTPKTVFDLDHDRELSLDGFELEPGTLNFLVSFPFVAREDAPGETTGVLLRLRVADDVLEAESPIVFEQRIPRRR
jgi:hypothetical protein